MRLYRATDRISIEFNSGTEDAFVCQFSPLTVEQKTNIMSMGTALKTASDPMELYSFAKTVIKYTFKGVKGVTLADGSEWVPEFDCGAISDQALEELLSLPTDGSFVKTAMAFVQGVPRGDVVIDPSTGEALPGVVVKKS